MARSTVNEGIDSANAGLEAARHGDTVLAAQQFDHARELFADASDRFDAWVGQAGPRRPGRGTAGARCHADERDRHRPRHVGEPRRAGRRSRRDQVDRRHRPAGEDRRARDAPHRGPGVAAQRLGRVAARSTPRGCVAPIDDKLSDLRDKVAKAARDAETGIQAARVVPALLGANGQTKRYFVAFQTPAEQRASGGIIGNYAVVSFTDGKLTLEVEGATATSTTEATVTARSPARPTTSTATSSTARRPPGRT